MQDSTKPSRNLGQAPARILMLSGSAFDFEQCSIQGTGDLMKCRGSSRQGSRSQPLADLRGLSNPDWILFHACSFNGCQNSCLSCPSHDCLQCTWSGATSMQSKISTMYQYATKSLSAGSWPKLANILNVPVKQTRAIMTDMQSHHQCLRRTQTSTEAPAQFAPWHASCHQASCYCPN